MRFKCFLMVIVFISAGHISRAEKHNATPELAEEFATAVKNVENKNFIAAVKIFESCHRTDFQKLNLICHFYIPAVWALQKITKWLSTGLGKHI